MEKKIDGQSVKLLATQKILFQGSYLRARMLVNGNYAAWNRGYRKKVLKQKERAQKKQTMWRKNANLTRNLEVL